MLLGECFCTFLISCGYRVDDYGGIALRRVDDCHWPVHDKRKQSSCFQTDAHLKAGNCLSIDLRDGCRAQDSEFQSIILFGYNGHLQKQLVSAQAAEDRCHDGEALNEESIRYFGNNESRGANDQESPRNIKPASKYEWLDLSASETM